MSEGLARGLHGRVGAATGLTFLGPLGIVCDYMLTVKDFVRRANFDDGIGRYCYPVDLHLSKPGDKKAFEAFWKEYEKDLNEDYGACPRRRAKTYDIDLISCF